MASDLLLEAFGQMVSQAGDVGRLNAAILQLAVQGRLVAQDPNDEPASELLKHIAAEKKRLGIKDKPLPEIGEEERPFPLPQTWQWVRLGNAISFEYGKGLPAKMRDANGNVPVYGSNGVVGCHSEVLVDQDCIVVGRKGSSGAVNLAHGKSWVIDTAFYILPPKEIDLKFLFRLLQNLRLDQFGKGIKPGLNRNEAYQIVIALPPLAEQKRIVERVDALLAQTRELENRLTQAETTLTAVHDTGITTLLAATDPDDFAARWQFIADNFDVLYDETYPETAVANIAQLKQAILQLAVQGKLTRQDPHDEPVGVLLQRIAVQKKRLGIKSKKLPEIGEEERPYALPAGWAWARFPELGEFGRGKSKHRPRNDPVLYKNGKYPFVQTGEVARSNGTITSYTQLYSEKGLAQSKMWPKGTSCITIAANIAETGILGFDACFPDSVVGFVPAELIGLAEYFQYFVTVAKNELEAYAPATAQKNINLGILQSLLIPLPPLVETKRIVARVNSLLRLCDDLSAHIRAAQATRTALRAAALAM